MGMTMQNEFSAMTRQKRLKCCLVRKSLPPGTRTGNRWMVDQHHSHKMPASCLVKDTFKLLQLHFANAAGSKQRYGGTRGGNADESHVAPDSQGGKNNTVVLNHFRATLV
jgi:hypothetical protein